MRVVRTLGATLLPALVLAQVARADCVGATATFNESGLIVPFQNLCGQDLTADVDFVDRLKEPSREHCLTRCVQKAPICYGFDFAEDNLEPFNCWLKQSPVSSSQTNRTARVNAAILMPDILPSLSSDCFQLGLYGCFQKNGQLGTGTATSSAATVTGSPLPTNTSTGPGGVAATSSAASSDGTGNALSADAKAGIGAGLGGAAFLTIVAGAFWLLKQRKQIVQQQYDINVLQEHTPPEKYASIIDGREVNEMAAQSVEHARAELECTEVMGRQNGSVEAISASR